MLQFARPIRSWEPCDAMGGSWAPRQALVHQMLPSIAFVGMVPCVDAVGCPVSHILEELGSLGTTNLGQAE